MALFTSTPLSTLSSDTDSAGSAQLYGFLGEVLQEIQRGATSKAQKDSFAALLKSLAENFLVKLPNPTQARWESQKEAIKLTDRSIDIIKEVVVKVDGIIEADSSLVQVLLKGLFHLTCTLNLWISDADAKEQYDDTTINPPTLREKAIRCMVALVIYLSGPVKFALALRLHQNMDIGNILREFLDAGKELLESVTLSASGSDVALRLFAQPRITSENSINFSDQLPALILPGRHQCLLAVLTLNEVLALTIEESSLLREIFPQFPRQCLMNILASCDVILSVSCTQRDQEFCLWKLVEILKHLAPHNRVGHSIIISILNRLLNLRITEVPFKTAPSLDESLVSLSRCLCELNEVSGVMAHPSIDQLEIEPLSTLKVSLAPVKLQ